MTKKLKWGKRKSGREGKGKSQQNLASAEDRRNIFFNHFLNLECVLFPHFSHSDLQNSLKMGTKLTLRQVHLMNGTRHVDILDLYGAALQFIFHSSLFFLFIIYLVCKKEVSVVIL